MQRELFAILLDGGFVTKRLYKQLSRHATVDDIVEKCKKLQETDSVSNYDLLRIYWYDAHPSSEKVRRPISNQDYNLAETERFRKSQSLFDQLILKDNFALRMGQVNLSPNKWRLKNSALKSIIRNTRDLQDHDFELDLSQKGVDMRVGMDMARLALREMVRAVVVVTGDSDFVPAFKFVRREGVKVILDPMGHNVRTELKQHADIVLG